MEKIFKNSVASPAQLKKLFITIFSFYFIHGKCLFFWNKIFENLQIYRYEFDVC